MSKIRLNLGIWLTANKDFSKSQKPNLFPHQEYPHFSLSSLLLQCFLLSYTHFHGCTTNFVDGLTESCWFFSIKPPPQGPNLLPKLSTYTKYILMPWHTTFDLQKSSWSLFFEIFPLWNCLWKGLVLNKSSAHTANISFKALFFSRYPWPKPAIKVPAEDLEGSSKKRKGS